MDPFDVGRKQRLRRNPVWFFSRQHFSPAADDLHIVCAHHSVTVPRRRSLD